MTEPIVTLEHNGHKFYFLDTPQAPALIGEIFSDNYKIFEREIDLGPGDIILDIGACEGMFSIMIAKLFPEVRVISYEPVPRTFYKLVRNIGLNGVTNITPYNIGVGPGRGRMEFAIGQNDHSGGSSGVMTYNVALHDKVVVDIVPLDEVLANLPHVKLMKMDIEGMEYDALYPSTMLNKVEYMVMELHTNKKLQDRGFNINELATWVGSQTNLVFFEPCYMAE